MTCPECRSPRDPETALSLYGQRQWDAAGNGQYPPEPLEPDGWEAGS